MAKTQIKITKPVYLGFSVLGLSKVEKYKFWYGNVKTKYEKNKTVFHR